MFKKLVSSQFRINMASGVATTVVNILVMAVGYPIYLHFLGYEKYGVWLVLATVMTFAQLGNLGIGPAVMKLVAEDYGRRDIVGIQHCVTTAIALLCISGTVGLIVLLILKHQIISAFKLSRENAQMVLWLLPYIGVLSIYVFVVQVFEVTLSGFGRMDLTNYIQSLSRVVNMTVACLLLNVGFGVKSLLIGSILSYMLIHIANLICISHIARIRLLRIGNLDASHCRRLVRFGGAVFAGSLISMLFNPFNKLMLSRYAGVSAVAVYEIAFSGSMHVRSLIESGLRPLMPEISRLNGIAAEYARDRIIQIYRRAMKLILFVGLPIYVTLAMFCWPLLKVWLGDRFVETLPGALRIMLIGTFLSLLGAPAYYVLMGMGHVRHNLGAHIVQATTNLVTVLCVLVVLTVSTESIAWSSSIAMGGANLYLVLQKRRVLQRVSSE